MRRKVSKCFCRLLCSCILPLFCAPLAMRISLQGFSFTGRQVGYPEINRCPRHKKTGQSLDLSRHMAQRQCRDCGQLFFSDRPARGVPGQDLAMAPPERKTRPEPVMRLWACNGFINRKWQGISALLLVFKQAEDDPQGSQGQQCAGGDLSRCQGSLPPGRDRHETGVL